MKILLVSQFFWPENFIINDLMKKIARLGHGVDVFTGKPNYPGGDIFDGYEQYGDQFEIYDTNIEVFRSPVVPRKSGGAKELIVNYLSFVWYGITHFPKFAKKKEYDVILVFATSPITAAIPAIFLRFIKRTHLIVWVQDLWPQSLSATGFIKNPFVLKLIGVMVRAIYFCADTILVQSKAFIEPVAEYTDRKKIVYYPNSFDLAGLKGGVDLPLEFKNILENNFCVVFAGNIGKAQSVETLIDAAARLRELPDFKLVLVGSGSMMEWVQDRKRELGLDNLILAGRYDSEAMPYIYRLADGLVVTLKNEDIFSYTIPSKIQTYLAMAKPIVAAINGEGGKVIKEADAGFVCSAEDSKGLAELMRKLYHTGIEDRTRLGENGYKYFIDNFEMNKKVDELLSIFKSRALKG